LSGDFKELFKDLNPQTVKGYQTSLASVLLPLIMPDAINSPVLSQQLKAWRLLNPASLRFFLHALKGPPYEPSSVALFRELVHKMVFQLAMDVLVSSRRSCLRRNTVNLLLKAKL
jgi:hypothetical protein